MLWFLFVVLALTCSLGVPLPHLLYQRARGYKEGNRVGYNMFPIRTLSLLAYFTYIFIDIIIYVLGSMPWSSIIFWIMG
jgi:Trk-type K+ transport system membrane component